MKRVFLVLVCLALAAVSGAATMDVTDLRCECLVEPLGIDSTSPHFSWKLSCRRPAVQSAYEIQVGSNALALRLGRCDLWQSGKVQSADQVMVPYGGTPLSSRQLCWWRVRVWDADGKASRWSPVQRFAVGVIGDDSLKGGYIGYNPEPGMSPLLRKSFKLKKNPRTAFLHVNSLGYHEVYVNGCKVSGAVLAPAVSQLDRRSLIVTYDVSDFLRKGGNEVVLWISSGWYRKAFNSSGCALVKAEMDVLEKGEWQCVLSTDASWDGYGSGYYDFASWTPGRFFRTRIDAAKQLKSLSAKSFDALEPGRVEVVSIPDSIKATPQMCEPDMIQEEIPAREVTQISDSVWLVDMGTTVNAMTLVKLPQLPEGHTVEAVFYDKPGFHYPGNNWYMSSGRPEGDVFYNRFNHYGFRYIELRNLPVRPAPEDIKALRMRTAYAEESSFVSSDEELNAIHDMVRWTMQNLAFSGYMVDCPHIERLGYGGDGNASTLSLQTMFGVDGLYMNWLQAWNDCIRPDGGLPHTAPNPYAAGGGPYWCSFIVQAPWRTYMSYGDPRPLERCYDSMKLWLGYAERHMVDGLLRTWSRENYREWYLGDWALPSMIKPTQTDMLSIDLVNNCALSQSLDDLEKVALALDRPGDAAAFAAKRDSLNSRIHAEFYDAGANVYGTGTQIDMAYPLLVGAVPEDIRASVVDTLACRTERLFDGHLCTGLVGVPVITEWATLDRQVDLMYGMLKQHSYPGYLFMLDNGATATWEEWEKTTRSSIHNCYNGIGSWFYQALGGIIPLEPGYRRTLIDPQIPEGLGSVDVSVDTPYGIVSVSWKSSPDEYSEHPSDSNPAAGGNRVDYHLEIPSGVTAVFHGRELTCGVYDFNE